MIKLRLCLSLVCATVLCGVGAAHAADKDTLSEAQAMGAMLTSNAAEVNIGQIMAARTADPKVRAYATRLLDDHLSANRDLLAMIERSGTYAVESKLRDQMYADGQKEVANLWMMEPGAALDKKFLTQTIDDHVADLAAIDTRLLPSVSTAEVKTAFTAMRATVAGHLQEACQLGAPMGIQAKGCMQETMKPGTR